MKNYIEIFMHDNNLDYEDEFKLSPGFFDPKGVYSFMYDDMTLLFYNEQLCHSDMLINILEGNHEVI